jgi:hypothetical protein
VFYRQFFFFKLNILRRDIDDGLWKNCRQKLFCLLTSFRLSVLHKKCKVAWPIDVFSVKKKFIFFKFFFNFNVYRYRFRIQIQIIFACDPRFQCAFSMHMILESSIFILLMLRKLFFTVKSDCQMINLCICA